MADDLTKQIADLRDAMASGVLTLRDGDNGLITYRSYAEMRQALSDLLARQAAEAPVAAPVRRTRQVVMTGRNGW